ncbi:hypothetical protein ACN9JG_09930 [Cereibacter azotoformans]|uniref:hypothetical protein n=1 Tax=Cereibacter azotoformans TaxID=43057 RepID=UPI003B2227B0
MTGATRCLTTVPRYTLKLRKKNGRPKIMPPADYSPSEDQTQDPHILRAIGRAWGWRRRMEAGEFTTIQELAEAVGLAERHVSRQLRLAYLAPEVLKRLTCSREASAVSLYDLCFLAGRHGRSRLSGRFTIFQRSFDWTNCMVNLIGAS